MSPFDVITGRSLVNFSRAVSKNLFDRNSDYSVLKQSSRVNQEFNRAKVVKSLNGIFRSIKSMKEGFAGFSLIFRRLAIFAS